MGEAANRIVDEGLWKQRTNNDGVPQFRSFKQFCKEEIGMTAVHVYRAMKVAKHFTPEELTGVSGRNLRIALEVPTESRPALLERAKKGDSPAKLTEHANKLRGNRKPLPPPKNSITVALTQSKTKLKMYQLQKSGSAKVGETDGAKAATTLAQLPWAVMELANHVRALFRLGKKPNGELFLDVEFRRGEPA